jgi:YVTN family beta-propeller protein
MSLTKAVMATALVTLTCVAQAQPFAYVTNYGGNSVSVIDTGTNSVTTTIPVGVSPAGVCMNPDGSVIYVVNGGGSPGPGSVSLIDAAFNTVIGSIEVGADAKFCALDPAGKFLYVGFYGEGAGNGGIDVIDTGTYAVTATIPIGLSPEEIALNAAGTELYVVQPNGISNAGQVTVIDTATNTIVGAPIAVGKQPFDIAFSPDGTNAYVTNEIDKTLSVIDTASLTVSTISLSGVGGAPTSVAINPAGTYLYVGTMTEGTNGGLVAIVDTATKTVTQSIQIGTSLDVGGIAFNASGSIAYVIDFTNQAVRLIDTSSNSLEAESLAVGLGPAKIAIGPGDTAPPPTSCLSEPPVPTPRLFVDGYGGLSVIDATTNNVVNTIYAANMGLT